MKKRNQHEARDTFRVAYSFGASDEGFDFSFPGIVLDNIC